MAVVRAYLMLFTGARRQSTVSLSITLRERIAALTVAGLILLGGLFPQLLITSRHHAAEEVLKQRSVPTNSGPERRSAGGRQQGTVYVPCEGGLPPGAVPLPPEASA